MCHITRLDPTLIEYESSKHDQINLTNLLKVDWTFLKLFY